MSYLAPAILIVVVLCSFNTVKANEFNGLEAWHELKAVLKADYAYLNSAQFDVDALFQEFAARAKKVSTKQEFADLSQMFLRHFTDPHLNLGPYNEYDFSVFPTGSDIRAVYLNDKFVIEDIKAGAAADLASIRPGAEIIAIDGLTVIKVVEKVFGREFKQLSLKQINYGLNIALGGLRNQTRVVEIKQQGQRKTYHLPASYDAINAMEKGPTVSFKRLGELGYIRFNNSLGNANTVKAFNRALTSLQDTNGIIIDLRDTPSGGNTGVAEPILGHFVNQKTAYQLYQTQEHGNPYHNASMQIAYVEPTKPYYTKPVVVLAGRWTGSMGEGMTIGFDAIGALSVVGAPMADLLGGIKIVKLEKSGTWLELGFERLYHVNNSFREDFVPHVLVNPADRDHKGKDPSLMRAQKILSEYALQSH